MIRRYIPCENGVLPDIQLPFPCVRLKALQSHLAGLGEAIGFSEPKDAGIGRRVIRSHKIRA
jgi:hypothetical protein